MAEESPEKTKIEVASTIYREIYNNIRQTDEISFKLLGFVPLVSGAGIFLISINKEFASSPLAPFISFFGAIVTSALFYWETRNIRFCRASIARARDMEQAVFGTILGELSDSRKRKSDAKVIAESILYVTSIIAWLALGASHFLTITWRG